MNIEIIQSDSAPAAIGPYSQATTFGQLVFCSGQVALHPQSGEMVGDSVSQQAEQVMQNLQAVLAAAGSDLNKVLRCTIYLCSMADFAAVNEVYGRYFKDFKPARATVAVSELPKNAMVEIDCIATR